MFIALSPVIDMMGAGAPKEVMMFYTVGEMANRLGVAPSTLRYYDKEGLLPFVERSGSGIRMFQDSDMEWLSIIECLKKTGMPIKDIKVFIDWCLEGDATISKRKELIEKQRQAVLDRIRQLNETLAVLDYKKWYYETAERAGTCKIHDKLKEDDIPEKFRETKRQMKAPVHLFLKAGGIKKKIINIYS